MTSFGKLKLTFNLKVETGLHIGGDDSYSSIGSADSLVMRDTSTNLPMIPGSSLKGKLRYLFNRFNENSPYQWTEKTHLLFGGIIKNKTTKETLVLPTKFQFNDAFVIVSEDDRLYTEVKSENTIKLLTGIANPRQIERVVRGTEFAVEIIYNIPNSAELTKLATLTTINSTAIDENIIADFSNLKTALDLLANDYLGGHGTRGYGRVSFNNFAINSVVGEIDENVLAKLKMIYN